MNQLPRDQAAFLVIVLLALCLVRSPAWGQEVSNPRAIPPTSSDTAAPAKPETEPKIRQEEASESGQEWAPQLQEETDSAAVSPTEEIELDTDSAEVKQAFNRGLEYLRTGRFLEASREFKVVEEHSVIPERVDAARSMNAYAAHLEQRAVEDPSIRIALRSGRVEFIVTSTVLGAFAGGVLIDILGIHDGRLGTAVFLAATGGALTGSLFGSRGMGLREADGNAYTSGALWGLVTTITTFSMLDNVLPDSSAEYMPSIALAGTFAGAASGVVLSHSLQATSGQVTLVGLGGYMGFWTSAMVNSLIPSREGIDDSALRSAIVLTGFQLGTGVGAWAAVDSDWSRTRGIVGGLGASIGALTVSGLSAIVYPHPTLAASSAIVGLWGGFTLTAYLTEDMAMDPEYIPAGSEVHLMPFFDGDTLGIGAYGTF